MQSSINLQAIERHHAKSVVHQSTWQRIILLIVLGYEGAGALAGGILLMIAPDGRLMDLPVEMMHGTFPDFMIPGIILFGMGILTTMAFFAVLRRSKYDWIFAVLSLGGLLIWFWIEIAILLELHWLHAMWGLPVVIGFIAAIPLVPRQIRLNTLLFCGILSSVLYFVINIIVPFQYDGYSHLSHTPSELSAIGAPTRILWTVLATPYTFLVLAFGWGVLKSANESWRIRVTGILMIAYGAVGFFWPFAPMHMRETLAAGGGTISDTMHIVLAAITNVIYLAALIIAAPALGKSFRIFSIMILILVFVFGTLTFLDAPDLGRNVPTPLLGLWERIDIGLFLIWIVVLASVLLRRTKKIR